MRQREFLHVSIELQKQGLQSITVKHSSSEDVVSKLTSHILYYKNEYPAKDSSQTHFV